MVIIGCLFRLLGHLYAAEALVLMDKLTEAIEHLNPDLVSDISIEFPKDETIDEEDTCNNTKPTPSNNSIITNDMFFYYLYIF